MRKNRRKAKNQQKKRPQYEIQVTQKGNELGK